MCGIAGFFSRKPCGSEEVMHELLACMGQRIGHRGPDDDGTYFDPQAGYGVVFRRLAIIDVSPNGHQPMESHSGRYVIAFNGEVYNYKRIRAELEEAGNLPPLRGGSDTEILLAAIEAWGVPDAVRRFNGMFGIAIWDKKDKKLFLIRDRVGVKPLYVGWFGDTLLFGSELKALKAHPAFKPEVDRDALALFLRFGYVPAPHSIYKNIVKARTGAILEIPMSGEPREHVFWDPDEIVANGATNRFIGNEVEATAELDALLRDSIAMRMVADVPLGAFLSGGVDSSLVVALMQAQSDRPVKTFTIGFHESGYNEAVHAKEVASHLGTDHTELYVTGDEAMAVVPQLATMFDEPFADSSQIPTYLVSKLARQKVTVSLSGDGGDELFGGYNRYLLASKVWRTYSGLPKPGQKLAKVALTSLSPRFWDFAYAAFGWAMPASLRFGNISDKVTRLADALESESPLTLYSNLVSQWKNPNELVIGGKEPPTPISKAPVPVSSDDFRELMMLLDLKTYLQEDIMAKVDRASMAVSLESREPLLDHRVIEFAWRLPVSMRLSDGSTKKLLRNVLYQHVPKELIERPKQGFAVPMGDWIRGPLRDWAEALLDESRLKHEGYLQPALIRKKWNEHLSGKRNWHFYLWSVLMFQAWHEEWIAPS